MKLDSCSILTSISVLLVETRQISGKLSKVGNLDREGPGAQYEGSGTGVTMQ